MSNIVRTRKIGKWPTLAMIAVLLVILAGSTHGARADSQDSAKDYFNQALMLGNGESQCTPDELLTKEALYRKAIGLDPGYAAAWNNLGDVYENLGEYVNAIDAYGKAKTVKPDMAEASFGIGDVYFKQGRYEKAVSSYDDGLKIDPNDELSKQRVKLARQALQQRQKRHVVTREVIIGALMPSDPNGKHLTTRGLGGIVNSPTVSLDHTVLPFDTDSAVLNTQAKEQLIELGKALSSEDLAAYSFEISGHTDERGSEAHGMWLGSKRADSVKSYLVSNCGIDPNRLVAKTYGSSRPIALGHDEISWAANRRVEIRRLETKPSGDLKISYGVLLAKPGGRYRLIDSHAASAKSGDRYQVYMRPATRCYVYIYQVDSSGKGFWLFPKDHSAAAQNPLDASGDYWFPRRDKSFTLDHTLGKETIYLLASRQPITYFDKLKQVANAPTEDVLSHIHCRGVGTFTAVDDSPFIPPHHRRAERRRTSTAPSLPFKEVFGSGEFQVAVSFTHN